MATAAMLTVLPTLAGLVPAGANAAGLTPGAQFTLPSGEEVTLHEVIRDDPRGYNTAWRYRFVMPSLAERVPPWPDNGWTDDITEEDMAELDQLGMEPVKGPFSADALAAAQMVTLEQLQAEGAIESDIVIDLSGAGIADDLPAIPADPKVLVQDDSHDDLIWLCETVVLPDLPASKAPRPDMIVISLSDHPVAFGETDTDAVQMFEGFSPSQDGKSCIWEPW